MFDMRKMARVMSPYPFPCGRGFPAFWTLCIFFLFRFRINEQVRLVTIGNRRRQANCNTLWDQSWTWVHFCWPNPIQYNPDVHNLHPLQSI